MPASIDRRRFVKGSAAAALLPGLTAVPDLARALSGLEATELGPGRAFSFETLQQDAKALSLYPFQKQAAPSPEIIGEIDYDQFQKIRRPPSATPPRSPRHCR